MRIANPIYREVIVRVLGQSAERAMDVEPRSFVRADGALDFGKVLDAFADFWRANGDILGCCPAGPSFPGFRSGLHSVDAGNGIEVLISQRPVHHVLHVGALHESAPRELKGQIQEVGIGHAPVPALHVLPAVREEERHERLPVQGAFQREDQ